MFKCLKRIRSGLPAGLEKLAQLGRSLWERRAEILAYFDVGVSGGPVQAINGRLNHLRGIALGFRNLDHYILRSLICSGQLQEADQRTLKQEGPAKSSAGRRERHESNRLANQCGNASIAGRSIRLKRSSPVQTVCRTVAGSAAFALTAIIASGSQSATKPLTIDRHCHSKTRNASG